MIMRIIGCLTIIRTDCGTKFLIGCMPYNMVLRHGHSDEFCGPKSFCYGSSTTNTVSFSYGHAYDETIIFICCDIVN